jgi:hypothetical protein
MPKDYVLEDYSHPEIEKRRYSGVVAFGQPRGIPRFCRETGKRVHLRVDETCGSCEKTGIRHPAEG